MINIHILNIYLFYTIVLNKPIICVLAALLGTLVCRGKLYLLEHYFSNKEISEIIVEWGSYNAVNVLDILLIINLAVSKILY